MIKALLIAPYSGLAETARKMQILDEIQLDITIANLEEGVQAAQLAEKQGYELIISRGGTAAMIQDVVSIPVVHIDITGYDMLRVFTLIRGIKNGVALVGFANISQGAATICNILEFDVKMVTIKSRDEVRGHLERLKQQGFSVVIGDVITVQVAEQVGLRGVLITSGKEAIMDALEEGKRVYKFFSKVSNKWNYFQDTFHSTPFPIILLNKDCEIIENNLRSEQYIRNHEFINSPVISKLINNVLENGRNQWAELEVENNLYDIQAFLASKSEAIVGVIIYASQMKAQAKAIRILGNPGHVPIIGVSRQVIQLKNNIKQYAHTDRTVCIIGEAGTGKQTVAKAIHFERNGQESPIVVIDGTYLTLENLEIEKLKSKFITIQRGTILLKNLESVPNDSQKSILTLLQYKPDSMKTIILGREPLDQLAREGKLDKDLYKSVNQYPLHLSPLRERKEDIRSFVDYFLAEFHEETGSETVGIKQEAVEYLKNDDWLGNLTQLKQTVRELSSMAAANYIELFHVKELMSRDTEGVQEQEEDNCFTLQGTLQDMEQQIIRKVLQEENNNQSKAANRLGINRSTLWRKLKQ